MKKNWFSNFLVLLLLVSCLEEEQIERSYPKVVTTAVTEISSSGALFSGRIESGNLEQILEYGFVWGEDDEFTPKNSFDISFGPPTANSVSAEIQSTLRIHVKYYMRFYIKTREKTIYGNLVDFVSLGSEGPVITKLTPETGVLGDTVVISGRNFYAQPDKIVVNFQTEVAPVIRRTDTTLVVTVPKTLRLDTEQIPVSASILGNIGRAPNPFVLQLSKIIPSITSVYPHSIKACDTITVVGKNFKSTADFITVALPHNQSVNLIKATQDSIQFSIKLLPPGEFGFTVTSGKFELTPSDDFEELRPQFISVSPAVFVPDGIMKVKVKNFPTCFPIVAAAGGYGAEVILQTENEVQIRIPDGCYYDESKIAFGVSYYDYFFLTPAIPSSPPRIFSIEPTHGPIGQEVVIQGENFGDITIYSPSLNLISYTSTEIRGTVNSVYGVYAPDGYFDVTLQSCATTVTLEDGFRFDPPVIFDFYPKVITSPDQNITIEGENFGPGYGNLVILYGPTVASASQFISQDNNRIVLSAGALINDLNEPLAEVKFSVPIAVRTDMGMEAVSAPNLTVDRDGPWKKLKDFPGTARHGAISFSAGGKGYVGLGRTINYTPVSDLWEFDPTTEDWKKKSGFPAAYGEEVNDAVVANDKAYILVMGNQLWQYDPSADLWTQKADFPGRASSRLIVMGIDNKVYAGGGYFNGTGSHEFWEYDPIVNVWSRKADAPADISNYIPFYQADGKGYMLSTTFNLEKRRLIYDPVTNSWSDQSFNSFIEPGGPWQVIDFENYNILFGAPPGYLQKNVMYKASPGSNSLTPLPFVGSSRNQAAGFSIGEMGYFGLGAYLSEFQDFWKFDPSKF